MKYIVEPKSRGFDVVDTTAVPRADGIWCYCADIERARVIAKLLNDRDDRELINRHARELNDEGNDSAAYQDLSDLENAPPESVDQNRAAYVTSSVKDHGPPKSWEELRALGGRTSITANESVWTDEENRHVASVRFGGISSERLKVSADFNDPLTDEELVEHGFGFMLEKKLASGRP